MCGTSRTHKTKKTRIHHSSHLLHHSPLGLLSHVTHHFPRTHDNAQEQTQHHSLTTTMNTITCLVCGAQNNPNVEYCGTCGNQIHTCPISQQKFKANDDFTQCPYCLTVFHSHHFDQWIQQQKQPICSYCKQPLTTVYRGKVGVNQVET